MIFKGRGIYIGLKFCRKYEIVLTVNWFDDLDSPKLNAPIPQDKFFSSNTNIDTKQE